MLLNIHHFSQILNVRQNTAKLLESDINCSNIFFELSPKIMEIETQINKWDLFKLKSFSIAKEKINKMKRQPTDWEEIFANFVINNGLVSKIYKKHTRLNNIKTTQSKPGQKTSIDISPKTYRWPRDT